MTTDSKLIESLRRHLFAEEDLHAYAVLDGASVPNLRFKLHDLEPEHVCLYRGELEPDMAEVAPYLIKLNAGDELTQWILAEGWGMHWGVYALSRSDIRSLRTHFRKFLMVHDSEGKPLYFRYYDPRVLRVYLPTCNADELKTFFGPVQTFLMEDKELTNGKKFVFSGGLLREEKLVLGGR